MEKFASPMIFNVFSCTTIARMLNAFYFVVNPCSMQLMMYVGNDFIEAVPLDALLISEPGYLGKFKRQLKQKHNQLLLESGETAEFLVINPVASTQNQNGS